MEKRKKNRGGKIAAAFVALTALTCCFVGTTFAKYTSSVDGSGAATVAHWEITGVSANSEQIYDFSTGGKLSPELTETSGSYVNTITQDYEISNKSDVGATISWSIDENPTITCIENAKYNGYTVEWVTNQADISGAIGNYTGLIYTDTSSGSGVKTALLSETEINNTIKITITATYNSATVSGTTQDLVALSESGTADKMTITVSATWTTASENGDKIDTLIGMYVKDVAKKLTVTATQNSDLPTD